MKHQVTVDRGDGTAASFTSVQAVEERVLKVAALRDEFKANYELGLRNLESELEALRAARAILKAIDEADKVLISLDLEPEDFGSAILARKALKDLSFGQMYGGMGIPRQ